MNLLEALSHIKEISGLTAVGKEKLLEMYDIIKELKDLSYTETASYIVQTLIDKIHYIDYINETYDDAEARIENIDEFKNSILELENVVGELRLNEYLESKDIDSLTFIGMQAEFCVDVSTKIAYELGYKVELVRDAITTFDNKFFTAEQILTFYDECIWNERFAKVKNTDDIIKRW